MGGTLHLAIGRAHNAIATSSQFGYGWRSNPRIARVVYICICNALTDGDIHHAATVDGARRPLEVFEACRCRVQCGTCVRKLLALVKQSIASVEIAPEASDNMPVPAQSAA
jgi:bacterioferritin-associated ferredoxin